MDSSSSSTDGSLSDVSSDSYSSDSSSSQDESTPMAPSNRAGSKTTLMPTAKIATPLPSKRAPAATTAAGPQRLPPPAGTLGKKVPMAVSSSSAAAVAVLPKSTPSSSTAGGSSPASSTPFDAKALATSLVNAGPLEFKHRDDEKIPLLPTAQTGGGRGGTHDLARIMTLLHTRTLFPLRHYRHIDYLLGGTCLFLEELEKEYQQQLVRRQRDGKPYERFTWANTGMLAIHFALACDCAKLLHGCLILMPQRTSPDFDAFIGAYLEFLQRHSKVPSTILTTQTYMVKLKDWRKGGTRYTGGDHEVVNNVRFPSATQRREKLEAFLSASAAPVAIASTVIATEVVGGGAGGSSASRGGSVASASSDSSCGSGFGPRAPAPGGRTATKSMMRLVKTHPWRQLVLQLFGGRALLHYPPEQVAMMPGFVTAAEQAPDKADKQYVLRLLTGSSMHSSLVLGAFDAHKGLLVVRDWALAAADRSDFFLLHSLVEFVSNRFDRYSSLTREGWLALRPLTEKPGQAESSSSASAGPPTAADTKSPVVVDDDASTADPTPPQPPVVMVNTIDYLRRRVAAGAAKAGDALEGHITTYLDAIAAKLHAKSPFQRDGGGMAPPTRLSALRPVQDNADDLDIVAQEAADSARRRLELEAQARRWRQQQLLARVYCAWGGGGRTADLPLITEPLRPLPGGPRMPPELQNLIRAVCAPRQQPTRSADETDEDSNMAEQDPPELPLPEGERTALQAALISYAMERQYALHERVTEAGGFSLGADRGGSGSGDAASSSPAERAPKRPREESSEDEGAVGDAEGAMVQGVDRSKSAPLPLWYNPYDVLGAAAAWYVGSAATTSPTNTSAAVTKIATGGL